MSEDIERVLVTGGAGFIGSHLVDRLLASGHQVVVLDDFSSGKRENIAQHTGDARLLVIEADVAGDLDAALDTAHAASPITRVAHLAAKVSVVASLEDPLEDLRVNAGGTLRVLEWARRHAVRKVAFASSAAVYGDVAEVPTPERAPCAPISPYGIHKRSSERYLALYAEVHGLPTTSLRFLNVFGPRQDASSPYSGVISIFFERARAGLPLTVYGDGEQTRDFVYVADVTDALERALFSSPDVVGPLNVGTGVGTSVNQLAAAVLEVLGAQLEVRHDEARGGEIRHSCAVVDAAAQQLGFHAGYELKRGLAEMIDV
ncbi:MAG: NAD-dependent epimerase/dehydratase family protein [Deltaproteobacteria bacterium]|nr:NAD-dependent epimerase/dehydratase family protein [Deltaproteobacteria bacterium]